MKYKWNYILWMKMSPMTQEAGQIVSGNLVYGPLTFFVWNISLSPLRMRSVRPDTTTLPPLLHFSTTDDKDDCQTKKHCTLHLLPRVHGSNSTDMKAIFQCFPGFGGPILPRHLVFPMRIAESSLGIDTAQMYWEVGYKTSRCNLRHFYSFRLNNADIV